MSHLAFVMLSYGITALTVAALIVWVLLDQRGRQAELAELEARGVRRRSAAPAGASDDQQ
ncbi:heme exporter protein CcmD [Hoeflea prorocentri]|uniref:Heme exporter protein D n=1 Tax=Hoeflea prorocentri TaxID=1922333 RepID=A0A9X3UMC8_9HYPH|nr:heme exporter protein CcmD [Hoeflea prorocentri]MCY6383378.1 heme exporter protein CcmD [Hoeflea prorocentri]MDA5401178.1 heme exporter protein CcmD [Hoeflea prorocentri]